MRYKKSRKTIYLNIPIDISKQTNKSRFKEKLSINNNTQINKQKQLRYIFSLTYSRHTPPTDDSFRLCNN